MKPQTFITALLLSATLLVDAVAFRHLGTQVFPQPAAILLLALGLAQTGMVAAWLVLGELPITGRFAGLLLAIMILSIPLAKASAPSAIQWIGVLTLYSAAIAFPLSGKRLRSSQRYLDAAKENSRRIASPRWQFSLGSLLAMTTGVAFVMGASRWVDARDGTVLSLLSCCLGFALVALCSIWAATRGNNLIGSVAILSLACLTIGSLVGAINSPGDGPWIYSMMAFAQATTILLCLGALRLSGVLSTERTTVPQSIIV